VADVVLQQCYALNDVREDLMAHCRRHLASWKVPVFIRESDAIDITPAGKVARA
jgi:acyl-CoA synthetase (AMP-forming)/AMP-acid ligase II